MVIDYWRQLDIVTPRDLDLDINLVGAGGLGSPIAFALAKMGCSRLKVYDGDVVELHNLPNQMYRTADVGKPKAIALASLLSTFAPVQIEAFHEEVGARSIAGVLIVAVDSMAARREIWVNCARYKPAVTFFVDARLGGEIGRVLSLNPLRADHVRAYELSLFTDEEAAPLECSAASTIYSALGTATLVANQVKRFARGQSTARDQILDYSTLTMLVK